MTAGATGGDTLLNIPPCSMAEGPGEQSQSLFRPPMSDQRWIWSAREVHNQK